MQTHTLSVKNLYYTYAVSQYLCIKLLMSCELHVLHVNIVQINMLTFYYIEVLFYQVHKIHKVWTITVQFQRFTFMKFLNY